MYSFIILYLPIVCPTFKVKSLSVSISLPFTSLHLPLPLLSVFMKFYFLLNPFTFFTQPLNPLPLWQLSICFLYLWICFYYVCLFLLFTRFHIKVELSLVFVFLWLTYFTLVHCQWECRLVQPLWRTVWSFLKKLKMDLPYDTAIPLLGIYPKTHETLI